MDLLRILDAKPEPTIVDVNHFHIDPLYQASKIYKIATPMSDFQKELIDQIISLHYSDILLFFETHDSSAKKLEIIRSSLNTLLENSKLVCLHPYLLIDHFFPKSLTTRDLPTRLAETSGKFHILNDILYQLDSIYNTKNKNAKSVHLGILVREGKPMDLVDALCIGHKCNLKRYAGIKLRDSTANQKKNSNLNLNIHLLPTTVDSLHEKEYSTFKSTHIKLDFTILLDLNLDTNNPVITPLCDMHTTYIKLVPINSVEHIESYYETSVSSRGVEEFLKPVTSAMVCLREQVGKLPSILKPAYNKNLTYLRDYFADPQNVKWPLPDLPAIGNYTSRDVEKSLLTEVKFNFDNEELLKEEMENQQSSVECSLNTNFGGKTKMIGHIIQPRFSKKNMKFKNFYENKRLLKNYLTNPLNNEYETLTGISKEINHHDVLTHTLVYHFDTAIHKMIDLNRQVASFNEFAIARENDYNTMIDAYKTLSNRVVDRETALGKVDSEVDLINADIDAIKVAVAGLQAEIVDITKEENDSAGVAALDREKYALLEEIARMEAKIEAGSNESKYMRAEIERAEKSIDESREKAELLTVTNNGLVAKVDALKSDDSEVVAAEKELDASRAKLATVKKEADDIKMLMEETMVKLNEIGSRPRHVNYYSRNK